MAMPVSMLPTPVCPGPLEHDNAPRPQRQHRKPVYCQNSHTDTVIPGTAYPCLGCRVLLDQIPGRCLDSPYTSIFCDVLHFRVIHSSLMNASLDCCILNIFGQDMMSDKRWSARLPAIQAQLQELCRDIVRQGLVSRSVYC